MKQLISCCGLDCESCDAHIATAANDDKLREETAQKWRVMYEAPNIDAASINCTGCRVAGVKFSQWNVCEIRKCVQEKGFSTCGDCKELETCNTVGFVLQNVPDARDNLIKK